jgi:hypothetical protein
MTRLTRHASRGALLAWIEGILIERSYRVAEKQLIEDGLAAAEHPWPIGRCVESSMDLRDVLHQRYPEMGAVFVYGVYAIADRRFFHAWVQLPDDTIIDITGTQFKRGQSPESTLLVLPTDRDAERYSEIEREPSWAKS